MPGIASTQLKIGMEIHVELATRTKMFTRTANVAHPDNYDAPPNSLIDPVTLGLPGTLPVMNRSAVEMAMRVGLALNCDIAEYSKWDRKNYFYPDLPKGYQISQYDLPLCFDGKVEITTPEGEKRTIGIIRAHLEEDAGKLGHELPGGKPYDGTLVDLNRAGTPLLEIVSAPDITSAEEAVIFARELRSICRFLRVSECDMQRGHIRFEPNINVVIFTDDGHEYVTPVVEVKNLNSFRSLQECIEFEHARQVDEWQRDGRVMGPGEKTTRGWSQQRSETFLQRSKEDAHDYRYFPEPDLVPVAVDEAWRERVRAVVPELPRERRRRYIDSYEMSAKEADALIADPDVSDFFEACIGEIDAHTELAAPDPAIGHACASVLLNSGAKRANERECGVHELGISPLQVAQLIEMREADLINATAADQLFGLLCESDDDASALAEQHGLLQMRDEGQLVQWVDEAIKAEPDAAKDYAAGKDQAVGRLIGSVMKQSGGRANANDVRALLNEKLRD